MANTNRKIVVLIETFEKRGERGMAEDLQNRIDEIINASGADNFTVSQSQSVDVKGVTTVVIILSLFYE